MALQQTSLALMSSPGRRRVVAVIGDNSLDPNTMEASVIAGEESHKQQIAEDVSALLGRVYALLTWQLCSNSKAQPSSHAGFQPTKLTFGNIDVMCLDLCLA